MAQPTLVAVQAGTGQTRVRSHFQRLILTADVAVMRAPADVPIADDLPRSRKTGAASFASTASECDKEQNTKRAEKNVVGALDNPGPVEQFDWEDFFGRKSGAASFAPTPSECDKEQNTKPAQRNVVGATDKPRPVEQFDLDSFFGLGAASSMSSKRSCEEFDMPAPTSCACVASPAPHTEACGNAAEDSAAADITTEASQRKNALGVTMFNLRTETEKPRKTEQELMMDAATCIADTFLRRHVTMPAATNDPVESTMECNSGRRLPVVESLPS